jgi:hypothetical protein
MEELPVEILHLIIESIDNMRDFYNFAISGRNIAYSTQSSVIQEKMKRKFGKTTWFTTSVCYPQLQIRTFKSYKQRKVYKIPSYPFTLEEEDAESPEPLTNAKLSGIIEIILIHNRHEEFSFACIGYSGE